RTRVIGAGRERARTIDAVYGHGHGGTRWPGGRVAELAVEVAPPALHGPVSKESARVLVPAGDGDSSGETAHRDRNDTELIERPVAVLSELAQPPALARAVCEQRARELVASRNARGSRKIADRAEYGGVVLRPVRELSPLIARDALRRSVGKTHALVFNAGR